VGLVATSTTYVGLVLYHLSAVPQLAVIASST
jgi:hypothetical protein